jgi:hypothetical protein
MNSIREEFSEYLKANLTFRRVFALGVGIACVVVCVAVVFGKMNLELWQTVLVLILGLLFFEWAG